MNRQATWSRQSYAQWIRAIVGQRRADAPLIPFFDSAVPEPTELLRATVEEAFRAPMTSRYVSAFSGGNPFVLDQLSARYGVAREQVLCTAGATGALALIYRALLAPGDHVLIESPAFDLFEELALAHGARISRFRRLAEQDFAIDMDVLEHELRPDTRLIVLSDLHNPSGMALGVEGMWRLAALAERRGVVIVVDEVYGDYADAATRPEPAAKLSPYLISIGSLTKIYGLGTLRCGWIVAAPRIMAPIREVGERLDFAISNLGHAIAALVMERAPVFRAAGAALLDAVRPEMRRRFADWRARGLIEGEIPPFGCICFPRLPGIANTLRFAEGLLARSGVIVAPGEFFGAAGHVRIGFARPWAELQRGMDAIEQALVAVPALDEAGRPVSRTAKSAPPDIGPAHPAALAASPVLEGGE